MMKVNMMGEGNPGRIHDENEHDGGGEVKFWANSGMKDTDNSIIHAEDDAWSLELLKYKDATV